MGGRLTVSTTESIAVDTKGSLISQEESTRLQQEVRDLRDAVDQLNGNLCLKMTQWTRLRKSCLGAIHKPELHVAEAYEARKLAVETLRDMEANSRELSNQLHESSAALSR